MEAIILAGGKGTRLSSVVNGVPKPMADVNGTPFLGHVLGRLSASGVDRAILSVGWMFEAIRGYFGAKYKGIDMDYVIEDRPLGTGGAVKEALKSAREDDVFVLNGDTYFEVSLERLLKVHKEKDADVTISLKPMRDFDRYGTVTLDGNGKVAGFSEKRFERSGLVNAGFYVLKTRTAGIIGRYCPEESFSFEKDFLEVNVKALNVAPYVEDGYFIDIGIPEDYERAKKEFKMLREGRA